VSWEKMGFTTLKSSEILILDNPPSLGEIILPPVSSNLGDKSALQQTWQPSLDTRGDKTTV